MAFPFGWGLGLFTALLIAGRDFGQLPVATVPLGLVSALVFALVPFVRPSTRLKVLGGGALAFIALAWMIL